MQPGQLGTDKSGPLTYTANYVFNKADILGKGATATVFLGRHRVSFEHEYGVLVKRDINLSTIQTIFDRKICYIC